RRWRSRARGGRRCRGTEGNPRRRRAGAVRRRPWTPSEIDARAGPSVPHGTPRQAVISTSGERGARLGPDTTCATGGRDIGARRWVPRSLVALLAAVVAASPAAATGPAASSPTTTASVAAPSAEGIVLTGRGYGHGRGMSQNG